MLQPSIYSKGGIMKKKEEYVCVYYHKEVCHTHTCQHYTFPFWRVSWTNEMERSHKLLPFQLLTLITSSPSTRFPITYDAAPSFIYGNGATIKPGCISPSNHPCACFWLLRVYFLMYTCDQDSFQMAKRSCTCM